VKYSKSQPLRVNIEVRSNVATLIESKRNKVARMNFVQAQVEEKYFIFNLEYRNVALTRGIPHRLPTKSQRSTKPKIPSEMSETQGSHILHISVNLGKPDDPVFQTKLSGLAYNDYNSNFGYSGSKTRCSDFYWLVFNG
jgi:hypothetical protein